jgi:hypothetical protein
VKTFAGERVLWVAATVAILFLALGIAAARPFEPNAARRTAPSVTPLSTSAPTRPSVFRDDATNLLANASFEADADMNGIADGWGGDPTSATYKLVDAARFGSFSQLIAKDGIPDPVTRFSALQQRVSGIAGGRRYEVGVDYLSTFEGAADASRTVGIVVYSLDTAGAFIDSGTSIDWGWPATTTWSRKGLTFRAPANCAFLIVEFRFSVNGSVWLDGGSLREIEQ